ncbi:MAG: NmrA family NAD(P)-binding protein [Bauldia sp.]|nr:NmrA family NAD(P)-binding protein [Bauldia sp.]
MPGIDRSITLVTGATGKLGPLIVRGLLKRGTAVRVLSRRREAARDLFGSSVEIAVGDFTDRDSLRAAVEGVSRVLLLGPISADMVENQIAVVRVAAAAGVTRIVKISGSDWTFGPDGTFSGAAHEKIEKHLLASGVPAVSLRPNGWMQVSLPSAIESIRAGQPLHAAHGNAAVSYIDARDIADVAVAQLLVPTITPGVLVLTGGEALTTRDLAGIAALTLGRPVEVTDTAPPALVAGGHVNEFELSIVQQFIRILASGRAAPVTDTVERVLGRKPRTVAAYLAEHLTAQPAKGAA